MDSFALGGLEGHKEIAELLIDKGADVNAKSKRGEIPLHLAAQGGHKEIAELLIDKGADVYAKDKYEWTPLHLAAQGGHKEIAELLIAKRPYVDAGDYRDWTPLHWAACNSKRWAASRGHKEIVELLIAKGANVNARTENGRGITPLDMANDRIPNVQRVTGKPPTFSANTAARRVMNCKPLENETPPTNTIAARRKLPA